jgi:hypothetical protein
MGLGSPAGSALLHRVDRLDGSFHRATSQILSHLQVAARSVRGEPHRAFWSASCSEAKEFICKVLDRMIVGQSVTGV